MARMTPEKETEFEELSEYLYFFVTKVWGIPENDKTHPCNYLQQMCGNVTKSQVLAGLREAVNDTVECAQYFTPKEVAQFDAACRSQHVLTLSEVRRRYWRKYKTIIKKERIRDDTDYYLIIGLLNDTSASLSGIERELLNTLVLNYEARKAQQPH